MSGFPRRRIIRGKRGRKEVPGGTVRGETAGAFLSPAFAREKRWKEQYGIFPPSPHPLDQAIVLFGEKDPEVFCHMAARHHGLGGDADNFCLLSLYGEGCPLIEIQISSFLAWPEGDQYSIQGTCGGLTGGPSGLKWKYFFPADAPKQTFWKEWSLKRSYCSELLPWQTGNPGPLLNTMEKPILSFF